MSEKGTKIEVDIDKSLVLMGLCLVAFIASVVAICYTFLGIAYDTQYPPSCQFEERYRVNYGEYVVDGNTITAEGVEIVLGIDLETVFTGMSNSDKAKGVFTDLEYDIVLDGCMDYSGVLESSYSSVLWDSGELVDEEYVNNIYIENGEFNISCMSLLSDELITTGDLEVVISDGEVVGIILGADGVVDLYDALENSLSVTGYAGRGV